MVDSIRSLLQEKTALYRRLAQLAGEQLRRIEADDLRAFEEAATLRNGLQEHIASLDERMERLLRSRPVPERERWADAARRALEPMAREIQALDRRAMEQSREKRDIAARSLQHLRQGRRGVQGYGGAPRALPPRFIDQKG